MPDQRALFRASLPPAGVHLMDEIEAFANIEIEIDDGSGRDPLWQDVKSAACMVWPNRAVIYLPTGEAFTSQAAIHELLHIYDRWVAAQPQLDLRSENNIQRRIVSEVVSYLEHGIIMPKQRSMGFAEEQRWRTSWKAYWKEARKHVGPETFYSKIDMLLRWFQTGLVVNDPALIKQAKKVLRDRGVLYSAEVFKQQAHRVIAQRGALTACAVDHLGIPRQDVWLTRIDVKARQEVGYNLPPRSAYLSP